MLCLRTKNKFGEELVVYCPWYNTDRIEDDASNNSSIVAFVFIVAVTLGGRNYWENIEIIMWCIFIFDGECDWTACIYLYCGGCGALFHSIPMLCSEAPLHGCYNYSVKGTGSRINYWLRGVSSWMSMKKRELLVIRLFCDFVEMCYWGLDLCYYVLL